MRIGRVWLLLGASFGVACSSQELEPAASRLPECPSIDVTPCDTLDVACQARLLSLAACLYGVEAPPQVPIRVATADEVVAEREARDESSAPDDRERAVHFERALSELLLLQPGDLSGDGGSAEDYVDRIDGYYVDAKTGVTLINRGEPKNTVRANALLLHELIHAVQDAEYDFDTLEANEPPDFDAFLARRSVSEGQATMYHYRASVAMAGRDVSLIDWDGSFAQLRDDVLSYAYRDASPYFAAPATFPYAYGALLAYRDYSAEGPLYHRARFGNLPRRTLDVLSESVAGPAVTETPKLVEPPLPAPYVSVDHGVLGAFTLQLLAHRAGATIRASQELGLAWRADTIWIGRNADETAYLWELALDTPEHAQQLLALPDFPPHVTHELEGERLFLAGSGAPPDFLLEAGRAFLASRAKP